MSFLWDWLLDVLAALGLWKKEATILLLGLDNAGKTTLLHKLKHGEVRLFVPTQRPSVEEIDVGSVKFRAWDLGGHRQVRAWWRDYFVEADAIVFVVDSSDTERLSEAKEELEGLLAETSLDHLKGLLVLGNKSDLQSSLNTDQLISALALQDPIEEARPPVGVFRCSLVDGTGYLDAFRWLSSHL